MFLSLGEVVVVVQVNGWDVAVLAEAAGVARLVPFHFSRRYEKAPAAVYAEIAAISRAVVVPETVVID